MKVSISGLLRNAARDPGYKYSLGELCEHLKLLRDQPERHSEFFALYVFSDDSEYRAKLVEAGQQSGEAPVQQANHEIKPCTVDTCIDRDYHKVCRMQSCSSYTGLTS